MMRRLWSRIVRLCSVRLWCAHEWSCVHIDQITERGTYLMTFRCPNCGREEKQER